MTDCEMCPSVWCKSILIIVAVSMCAVLPIGYHMVVLNVPEKVIQAAINASLLRSGIQLSTNSMSIFWSILVSSQSLGALIGCFLVITVSRRFGTKRAMLLLNGCILLTGSLIMALPAIIDLVPLLVVGRTITGVYTGLAITMVPLFLHEVAPKEIKGALGCFIHISVCVGSAFGAVASLEYILGGESTWGFLLALPGIFAIAQIIFNWWLPETPNTLLNKGRQYEAAQSIRFYYRSTEPSDELVIEQYRELCTALPEQLSVSEAMSIPDIRWGIFIGMVVSATQVFSGSMAAISYSTSMFAAVSFVTFAIPYMPALGSLISAAVTVPAMRLVEVLGRRELLLNTLLICVAADFLLMLFSLASDDKAPGNWASYAFGVTFFVYGLGYNLGTGPVAYFIPGELVPPKAASASLGAAVAVNWISTMITTIAYYPLNIKFGGWSYLLFAMPSSFFLVFLYFFLPETKYLYQRKASMAPPQTQQRKTPEDYGSIAVRRIDV